MDRAELDRRLGALGYTCELDEQRGANGEIREMTWRRVVDHAVTEIKKHIPMVIDGEPFLVEGQQVYILDIQQETKPVTRSLYVVDSKDGLEIYNGGKRYTLDEIEKEEQAEREGNPLPPKVQLIT